MRQRMLKAKLHQARVTQCELDYDGSCAIDETLLQAANILPFEQIQVYNISNGERLTTYAIKAEAGSKTISLNGAAAHKAKPQDKIIICAYADYEEAELANYAPRLVYLDADNSIMERKSDIPAQAAE